MARRKAFLAALGTAGVSFVLGSENAAGATASKSASPAALAFASSLRRFDRKLGAADKDKIARAIDDNRKAAAALNPRKKRLKNGDEPVTTFAPA